jgi:RNA-binding protein YhbY
MTDALKRLDEIEVQEKALADEKVKLLAASKDADLEIVKKLCKQHGFTATQLRGFLKVKGKAKAGDGVVKKPRKAKSVTN